jgi:glycosyltransferase involved in cell wall biosynthesis
MALRVLHVGKFYPPVRGGMETFLSDLIEAQRSQGVEAFALVHGDPLAGDPEWLIRVPVLADLLYAPIAPSFRSAMAQAIERFQPQVLHLHMPNNSVFWALTLGAARRIPWLVHWHSDVLFADDRKMLMLAYKIYRPFEQGVLNQAERIVVTSPPYLKASRALAPWRQKCAVVPLGLASTAGSGQQEAGANQLPWRTGRLRLLSIGRLAYYKGFETLIRAVAGLPGVELVIAGSGELRSAMEALIETSTPFGQEAAAVLLGEVSEQMKHELLQSCDVFCLASRERTEAFGMVLLEAMLHGRPCLVSDLPGSGMPWVVQQAQCGDVVELDNEQGWRDTIARYARDPQERLRHGEAGRRAFDERFTVEACARTLTRHYAALAGETQASPLCNDILIVIPARDEAHTISSLIQSLRQTGWTHVLVVDDHSSDDTSSVARIAGAQVLRPVLHMGAWGAMQAGIRYAQAKGYEAVITMDADGQHEVSEIPKLLSMRDEADLVIGAFAARASPARRVAWRWFTRLTGLDLEDLTSGFRYYSKAAMRILASEEATLLDYQDLGTLLMVRKAGLRIAEISVTMNLRTVGKSRIFHSWFSVGRYMVLTTLICLSRWRVRRGNLLDK